jgi:uncharacterized membrane protein
MIDDRQIRKWVKEGTITEVQANKMLVDISKNQTEEKSNKFLSIIAIIGAVLIFIGFAWLIAKNWHQIPDFVRVLILVGATIAAFVSGVIIRHRNHEAVGRALITLGALLYILTLFLVSQIYNLTTTPQHYAWLLFFAWVIVLLTAYLIDSPENLVVSMLAFFPWVMLQYVSSILKITDVPEQGIILSLILIFISIGALLYGLSTFHNSIKHRFTNIFRFWTAFYFLLIFYVLSFQSLLPLLSEFSFVASTFTVFLIFFVSLCFLGSIIGVIFAANKSSISIKEILAFAGIIVILFVLIISTKAGAGLVGYCNAKSCYEFGTSFECSSAPDTLACEWTPQVNGGGVCQQQSCYEFNSTACSSDPISKKLNCTWENGMCQQSWDNSLYETCNGFTNQKNNCVSNSLCSWQIGSAFNSGSLPTSLWMLWIVNNFVFIGFIILILWYGQNIGSTKIVNLALFAFILEIISRYIGFWMDFKGYFAFSILAILGGLMLIFGAWQIPKWRRKLLDKTKKTGASR